MKTVRWEDTKRQVRELNPDWGRSRTGCVARAEPRDDAS